jgi:hypothetical protein
LIARVAVGRRRRRRRRGRGRRGSCRAGMPGMVVVGMSLLPAWSDFKYSTAV